MGRIYYLRLRGKRGLDRIECIGEQSFQLWKEKVTSMLILLLIYLAVSAGLTWVVSQKRLGSAGLPLAYFLGLSLIHVPGAIIYLDAEETNAARIGFEETTIGMVAFLVGVLVARHAFVHRQAAQTDRSQIENLTRRESAAINRLALIYISIGSIAFFVLLPAINLPSVTAIVSALGSLVVVGLCLRFWVAIKVRNGLRFWGMLALLPIIPLATLIQGGFLGFGTYWVLAIVTFLFAQSNRRFLYIVLAPVVLYVGLSIFVNYMAARNEIRQLVWYQQADIGDRLDRIVSIFREFEWFDLSNWRHRRIINSRLNQNDFIGVAAVRLETNAVEYAYGSTIGDMVIGLIPRALWPEKPSVGGGGAVVHHFTGITFAEGTSVGAGQVFEFYVNFGRLGVVGGFLLYGWLCGRMDLRVAESLRQQDQSQFVFWFLPSLALLQPGGNLVEIVVTAVSSFIVALGIAYLLRRRWLAVDVKRDRPRYLADDKRGYSKIF
jgi:hypothetical protein